MVALDERPSGFWCFTTVCDSFKDLKKNDPVRAANFMEAIIDYALTGSYDDSDNMINALMR